MKNENAQDSIDSCLPELSKIETLIEFLGHTSPVIPYLTKYAIIRACGTIEYSFKTIIADLHTGSPQVLNYIDKTIRSSSMNPSLDNISRTLKQFDDNWKTDFKNKLNTHEHSDRLKTSLNSLNSARNSFAHGQTSTATFENIKSYFEDAVVIIDIVDAVVN